MRKDRPTHILRCRYKKDGLERQSPVGYAYETPEGWLRIYLYPGVSLGFEHTVHPMTLTLFKQDELDKKESPDEG